MAKETATYISQLVATNPVASDSVSVGDDHLRMLKTVLKTQFSGLTGTTAVSSSEAELNILDGVTSTAAELNILDGVTSTAAELNILDGVTSTAAELNIMDGGTSATSTTLADADRLVVNDAGTMKQVALTDLEVYMESSLDTINAVTAATSLASVGTISSGTWAATDVAVAHGGTGSSTAAGALTNLGLSATAAELNIMDGVTSTAAELNIMDGVTSTTAELNLLDGVTSTTTELNYNDVTTLGTVQTSKVLTADSSGVVNHADYQTVRPYFKDYAEAVNAIGGTGGGTQDIDITAGNVVTATVDTSTNTFTFSNPSASGRSCSLTLILTNGGSQTVNWPSSVDWKDGTAPTLTSSGIDILTFMTVDGGTIWYGFHSVDMKSPS